MHTTSEAPTPRAEACGHWGTMDKLAKTAWPLAIVAIADTTGESLEAARAFLDSRLRRQFADEVRNRLQAGHAIQGAVRFATARRMTWTIDRTTSRNCIIPRALPYLLGLTIYYSVSGDATTK